MVRSAITSGNRRLVRVLPTERGYLWFRVIRRAQQFVSGDRSDAARRIRSSRRAGDELSGEVRWNDQNAEVDECVNDDRCEQPGGDHDDAEHDAEQSGQDDALDALVRWASPKMTPPMARSVNLSALGDT